MKKIILFLLLSPAIIFAQPKITDIIWKGQNNEYLEIGKFQKTD